MDIQSIGLQLEADIYDDETDTRVFVSSNTSSQVDGEEDSIIVVAFRGTASSTNVKTDMNFNQVSYFTFSGFHKKILMAKIILCSNYRCLCLSSLTLKILNNQNSKSK